MLCKYGLGKEWKTSVTFVDWLQTSPLYHILELFERRIVWFKGAHILDLWCWYYWFESFSFSLFLDSVAWIRWELCKESPLSSFSTYTHRCSQLSFLQSWLTLVLRLLGKVPTCQTWNVWHFLKTWVKFKTILTNPSGCNGFNTTPLSPSGRTRCIIYAFVKLPSIIFFLSGVPLTRIGRE